MNVFSILGTWLEIMVGNLKSTYVMLITELLIKYILHINICLEKRILYFHYEWRGIPEVKYYEDDNLYRFTIIIILLRSFI